jgi:hypothetical protein
MFYNFQKIRWSFAEKNWANTKTSSRSGDIGSSFGMWVARTVF